MYARARLRLRPLCFRKGCTLGPSGCVEVSDAVFFSSYASSLGGFERGGTTSDPSIFVEPVRSMGCPISWVAQRVPMTGERVLLPAAAPQTSSWGVAGLELQFGHAKQGIAKVSVTVHGKTLAEGMLPAALRPSEEITENFPLERPVGVHGLASATITTHRISSVLWVELTQIRFVDGSVWRPSQDEQCRTAPRVLQNVASR